MARYRLDVPALYLSLDMRRIRLRLNWAEVAAWTGLPAPTFTRLAAGRSVNADTYTTLLMWLAGDLQLHVPFAVEVPLP